LNSTAAATATTAATLAADAPNAPGAPAGTDVEVALFVGFSLEVPEGLCEDPVALVVLLFFVPVGVGAPLVADFVPLWGGRVLVVWVEFEFPGLSPPETISNLPE